MLAHTLVSFLVGLMVLLSAAAPIKPGGNDPIRCILPAGYHQCDCKDVFSKARTMDTDTGNDKYHECCLNACNNALRQTLSQNSACARIAQSNPDFEFELEDRSRTILDFQRCPEVLFNSLHANAEPQRVSMISSILCWEELQKKSGIQNHLKPYDLCADENTRTEEEPFLCDDVLADTPKQACAGRSRRA